MNRFTKHPAGFYYSVSAIVIGDVEIGEDSSIWFGAVVRGDVAPVRIGKRVNVQDNVVIHCDSGIENVIEDDVTIGHGAIIHGTFVGAGTLIGMGATLLGRSKIGRNCLIGAGAVVSPGTEVPDGQVVMGVPAKVVRPTREEDRKYMTWLPPHYVQLARKFAEQGFRDVLRD